MRVFIMVLIAALPAWAYYASSRQIDEIFLDSASHNYVDNNSTLQSEPLEGGIAESSTSIPLLYSLSVFPDLESKVMKGAVTIKLRSIIDSHGIFLRAEGITLLSASIATFQDNRRTDDSKASTEKVKSGPISQAIETVFKNETHFNFKFPKTILKGETYALSIVYKMDISSDNDGGLILSKRHPDFNSSAYSLYTVMGRFNAPKVFPCFYDPSIKVPFNLEIIHSEYYTPVAATQIARVNFLPSDRMATQFEQTDEIGLHQVSFALLSSYKQLQLLRSSSLMVGAYIPEYAHEDDYTYAQQQVPVIMSMLQNFFGTNFPLGKLTVLFVEQTNTLVRNEQSWGMLILGLQDTAGFLPSLVRQVVQQWIGGLIRGASAKAYWLQEAVISWMTRYILDRQYSYNSTSFSKDDKKFAMNFDFLDGRWSLMNTPNSKEDSKSIPLAVKIRVFMTTIEKYMGASKLFEGIQEFVTANINGTFSVKGIVSIFGQISDKPINSIINRWARVSGLPIVTITNRNQSHITVTLSLQGLLKANTENPKSAILPVYADFYLGDDRYQSLLLDRKKNIIKLDYPDAPYVIHDSSSDYAYYKPEYSNNYIRELAEVGKTDAMSIDGKTKLFDSLVDSPTSILMLAHEWKEHRQSRIPAIKALYSVSAILVRKKRLYAEVRRLQRDLLQRELRDLDLKKNSSSANNDLFPPLEKLQSVNEWSPQLLAAFNEACMLGIADYSEACKSFLRSFYDGVPFPASIAFGAFKETVRNQSIFSESVLNLLLVARLPIAIDKLSYRLAAAKALGADEGQQPRKLSIVLTTLSQIDSALLAQDGQAPIFSQMLQTMQAYSTPSEELWSWVRKNWDSSITKNSLLKDCVISSGIMRQAKISFEDSIFNFFADKKGLTFDDRVAIDRNILATNYKTVIVYSEKKRIAAFFKSRGNLSRGNIDTNIRNYATLSQSTRERLVYQVPIYESL